MSYVEVECSICERSGLRGQMVNIVADSPMPLPAQWAHASCASETGERQAERSYEDHYGHPTATQFEAMVNAWREKQSARR